MHGAVTTASALDTLNTASQAPSRRRAPREPAAIEWASRNAPPETGVRARPYSAARSGLKTGAANGTGLLAGSAWSSGSSQAPALNSAMALRAPAPGLPRRR